ncbi:hypothetical protein Pfo_016360 [Paulownia fortunei]|nr:hypothetical protein Pfo_016360 [Paulownia fortunei]
MILGYIKWATISLLIDHVEHKKDFLFLYHALLAHLRSQIIAFVTVTSRVATAIIPGGRTTHYYFKIPIDENKSYKCTMSQQNGAIELLRKVYKTPIAKRWAIKNVNKLLNDVTKNDEDFSGKVMIFYGDFRQVLQFLVKSYLWPKIKINYFIKKHGSSNDSIFSEFLLRVRNCEEPSDTKCNIKNSEEMIIELRNSTRMVCRIGQYTRKHVFILRVPLLPVENEGYPFQFRFKQFFIKLCFVMTIEKAQEQTVPNVDV